MHPRLAADLAELPDLLDAVRQGATAMLDGLGERPVAGGGTGTGTVRPRAGLPETGAGARGALEEFARRWEPGFSGSAGPRYLGFVTGGATPAALMGDWLVAAYDQNVVWGGDSTATELERETVERLRELFGLGAEQRGAFVTGATMSNTVGLALAREWVGEQQGVSVAQRGLGALDGPFRVLSGAPHSSVFKALSLLGAGRDAVRTVPLLPGREAVDVAALAAELDADPRPAVVVANAGTVNTGDFDDLRALAELRERRPFWLHVDAAFGAFAALSPDHAHLLDGIEAADSVCVDLHKWLNVPYDAAVQFTRHRALQTRVFQNAAAYLGAPDEGAEPDFVHLTPENSRRLRALPAWFALAAYGRAGHGDIVARNLRCARLLGQRLADVPGLRLLAPVRLNIVCFTVTTVTTGATEDGTAPAMEQLQGLARAVADTGEALLTPTVLDGVPALRAAFSNWRTDETDVDRIAEALRGAVRQSVSGG
ncbi:pyridoxal phosphate-dependent decarboxylase family protein [Streptomyces sp. NPDC048172]|uniref:pyridoxal phosphate-dependent decarboxylase family protein n=1 Tax=Streptomyces sp. NPDC048172 TaxID=3365505 RepID=UPI0037200BF4